MIKSNSVYCLIEEEKKWERDGRGSHFTRSGTGQESFLTLARDWDGTRFFSVGVGQDRSANPLLCHSLVPPSQLTQRTWFTGPAFLYKPSLHDEDTSQSFELLNPESDMEIRPEEISFLTQTQERGLTAGRFQRFSYMCSLIRAIALPHSDS